MFEISKGRFVDPNKIIGANVYQKSTGKMAPDKVTELKEIRVAIDLDTANKDKSSVYAGPFLDESAALAFIKSIPLKQN